MEKVRLPRVVIEAIEKLKSSGWTDEQILRNSIGNCFAMEEYFCLSDIELMILASALVIGYEVEQSAQEKAVEWLMEQDLIHRDAAIKWVDGIKTILEGKSPL